MTKNNPDNITLWAYQTQVVLDATERDGFSRVKQEYIDKKYGETAWSFNQAYSFFNRHAANLVPKPEGAESCIWLYADPKWGSMSPEQFALELSIPRDEVILFDMRIWNKILNVEYVADSDQDQARFDAELAKIGLGTTVPIFQTGFYPLQKREIQKSWERLFFPIDECPETYIQGAVWELRQEWIVQVKEYLG